MDNTRDTARAARDRALKLGAREVAVGLARSRRVEVEWRDGKLDKLSEATTRALSLQLYVDGRYAAVSTSDLRPDALNRFVADAVDLTRRLAPDPHRALPDPVLYAGRTTADLEILDEQHAAVTAQQRRDWARDAEAAAHGAPGHEDINSVTARFSDSLAETYGLHSNGFEGSQRETSFSVSASVSIRDADGRRPHEYEWAGARHRTALPAPAELGRAATARVMGRKGTQKLPSAVLPMVVENRVAGQLVSRLIGPLSASALQQKRSFLEGKVGTRVGSPLLDVVDDPHIPRGLGSRAFDGEGLAARKLPLFQAGVLRGYYVDNYYGRKLGLPPTTGSPSNHAWTPGSQDRAALLSAVKDGIFVTGFIGGNSNGTTGDFSLGVQGFRIRGGALAEPVGEMNIAGNHLAFWNRLTAVGNDPFTSSTLRTPTLVFDAVQFAGV